MTVIAILTFVGPIAMILAVAPPARAGPCDQVGGVITGDWTVTTPQVCVGILYTVDGTVNVNAGGSLTLVNGGLSFAKDSSHAGYALNVNAGGTLILDNSIVTTQTDAITPYVKLALTVSGANSRFQLMNGAVLKFPGWFNATSAIVNVTNSKITGFTDTDLAPLGINTDDNNDAPVMRWSSTTATMFGSRIERLYEYTSGANGTGYRNITLSATSSLYAYDTYIGLDYSDVAGWHNELLVDGTSNAYLYNVTIDRTQDPPSMTRWQPAYVPTAAGGGIFLLRWLRASAVDSTGFPVSGATIASTFSPSATPAEYPDAGFSTTPSQATLWWIGRTASGATAYDRTDAGGHATIPLYTDQVTTSSLPNAESFGNYQEVATYASTPVSTTQAGAYFAPYPAINAADNNNYLTLNFTSLSVRTEADLVIRQSEYTATMTVIENQPFTVYARVYNDGQKTATNAAVAGYLDGNRNPANEYGRASGFTVTFGGFTNQTMNVRGISGTGAHTLMLVADPDNNISEGGLAQENNNFANITLNVQPPPNGFVAILTPPPGQTVEPGTDLIVSGYVRDQNSVGIVGVPLTIQLRSGASVIVQNLTTSQGAGFFQGTLSVPGSTQEGPYTVVVTPSSSTLSSDSRPVTVRKIGSFLYQPLPFIGLPVWLFLIIIVAVTALVVGATLYFRVYGLGKMVECGECGSFIPVDSTSCPKCGVEFEKDMAKCSNCQAWIPVDVKQCPECGVEFATGKVEMADYQQKMRMQYDDVVQRFRREASGQLGRALSDGEFQDWWRKQPTFVTFEDWLREEEEMRKMGSKPCPACGTLNSVTATVCHKCGTYLKGERRPPSGGMPARRMASAEEGGDPGSGPSEPVPAKVIRRPGPPIPVPQKRAAKKSTEDQGEGSGDESSGGDTSVDDI